MTVQYQTDTDKHGRPRAVNVRLIELEGGPYIQRPGEARVYQTRVMMRAELLPVEFEPSALQRDRERHRDRRARRDKWVRLNATGFGRTDLNGF